MRSRSVQAEVSTARIRSIRSRHQDAPRSPAKIGWWSRARAARPRPAGMADRQVSGARGDGHVDVLPCEVLLIAGVHQVDTAPGGEALDQGLLQSRSTLFALSAHHHADCSNPSGVCVGSKRSRTAPAGDAVHLVEDTQAPLGVPRVLLLDGRGQPSLPKRALLIERERGPRHTARAERDQHPQEASGFLHERILQGRRHPGRRHHRATVN